LCAPVSLLFFKISIPLYLKLFIIFLGIAAFIPLTYFLPLSFSFLYFAGLLAPTMSFSSYPGMLSSLDDFYSMHETSLAVTQTTNGIYNTTLYDEVITG